MSDYLKVIINRFFPDPFVQERLNIIMPQILEYFGEDNFNLIIDALRSLEICVCPFEKEMSVFINNKLGIQIDNYYNNYLNASLINSSSGLSYSISSDVIYDKYQKDFIKKGRDRKIVFIKHPGLLKYKSSAAIQIAEEQIYRTIIHEVVHLVKSVKNNSVIRNGKRITRSGVQQTFNSIKYDGRNVYLEFLSESGRGFNEAVTEYDTINIFGSIFGYEPKNSAYPLEVEVLKRVLKTEDLIDAIHRCELNGDIVGLRNAFDCKFYEGSFDKQIRLFDKITKSSYKSNEYVYNGLKSEAEDFIASLKDDNLRLSVA